MSGTHFLKNLDLFTEDGKFNYAAVKLTKTEMKILEIIGEDQSITYGALSDTLGRELSTIRKAIKSLKEKGIIRRVGSDKTGYWERMK